MCGRESSSACLSTARWITQGSEQDSGPRIEGIKGTGRVLGWRIGGRYTDARLRNGTKRKEIRKKERKGKSKRKPRDGNERNE